MPFGCEKCGKLFKSNYGFDRHINKKTPCWNKSEMPFGCEKCGKLFKSNYGFDRHINKKTPCSNNNLSTSGSNNNLSTSGLNNNLSTSGSNNNLSTSGSNNNLSTSGSNNKIHFTNFTNFFGKEDHSHIFPERIIERLRMINKLEKDPYVRAAILITDFHKMLNENPLNINVTLSNIRSLVSKTLTESGTILIRHVNETVSDVVKTRAGQLINFEQSIETTNEKVFQSPTNQATWKDVHHFSELGLSHDDLYKTTRHVKTLAKIACLTQNHTVKIC